MHCEIGFNFGITSHTYRLGLGAMDIVWVEDSQDAVSFAVSAPPSELGFHAITPSAVPVLNCTWTPSTQMAPPVEPPAERIFNPKMFLRILKV